MIAFWALRRKICGEAAFLPLAATGHGALNAEAIALLNGGYIVRLLNDSEETYGYLYRSITVPTRQWVSKCHIATIALYVLRDIRGGGNFPEEGICSRGQRQGKMVFVPGLVAEVQYFFLLTLLTLYMTHVSLYSLNYSLCIQRPEFQACQVWPQVISMCSSFVSRLLPHQVPGYARLFTPVEE
jgi:hypothetical protein